MTFNRLKHHRRSIRLPGHDYSRPGKYFVTICSYQRQPIFTVRAGLAPAPAITDHPINNIREQFELTRIGRIIDEEWIRIPDLHTTVTLDEYVIMPDHFHGIIMFVDPDRRIKTLGSGAQAGYARASGSPDSGAQASCALTLGMVIASFKSRCTIRNLKFLKTNHVDEIGKIWHRNYYEHIIRGEIELSEIRHYIRNNPLEWWNNV